VQFAVLDATNYDSLLTAYIHCNMSDRYSLQIYGERIPLQDSSVKTTDGHAVCILSIKLPFAPVCWPHRTSL
jgi:hypothetical protein